MGPVSSCGQHRFPCTLIGRHLRSLPFVPRPFGYEGPVPGGLEALDLERLVTANHDGKMVSYLDFVGKIHPPKAGSKDLNVPLVQMNALGGFVADALLATILALVLDDQTRARTLRAFNKLLWLQNDLIVRHYAARTQRCGKPA